MLERRRRGNGRVAILNGARSNPFGWRPLGEIQSADTEVREERVAGEKVKRRKREKDGERRGEGVAMERCRLEPVHGFRIGCASKAEAGRDSKAGVSKRLVHPTTRGKVDVHQHRRNDHLTVGEVTLPASYPTEETAPHIGSRSRSVRLSLLPSESSKQSFHSARRSFPISSLFPRSPRFPYASMLFAQRQSSDRRALVVAAASAKSIGDSVRSVDRRQGA